MSRPALALAACLIASACTAPAGPSTSTEPLAPSGPPAPTIGAAQTPKPSPPLVIPTLPPKVSADTAFYRLLLEFTSRGDWATLDVTPGPAVLTRRVVAGTGLLLTGPDGEARANVGQPEALARAGGSVSLTIDLALAADAWERTVFVIRQSSLNGSVLRVSRIVGTDRLFITEFLHDRPTDDVQNPRSFALAPATPGTAVPEKIRLTRAAPKLLLAFYYPWYHEYQWTNCPESQRGTASQPSTSCSFVQLLDRPAATYSSADRLAILRQIDQARSAGIDGFLSSWWGPGDYTDANLKTLLAAAAERDFRVALSFELITSDPGTIGGNARPRSADEITHWLEYILATYGKDPAFMRLDGKPVIVFWQSPQVPLKTWRAVFGDLRPRGFDAAYIGYGFDTADLDVFDGLHFYGSFDGAAARFAGVGRDVRYYPLLADRATPKIWAAPAEPGYDDRVLPGRTGTFRDRKGGATYRASLDAAAASGADWIFITTWNEFAENTYIEPSENYGEQYLQITRDFALRWKSD